MTLAADGHMVKVHQVIIALASPYLKDLIASAQCPHPIIFLNVSLNYEKIGSILSKFNVCNVCALPPICFNSESVTMGIQKTQTNIRCCLYEKNMDITCTANNIIRKHGGDKW